jgi:hypothetical protein
MTPKEIILEMAFAIVFGALLYVVAVLFSVL